MSDKILERFCGIPFLTAPFASNFKLYLVLWPVWWALGLEQLLLPFFIGWEFLRTLVRSRGRLQWETTTAVAGLLAVWWIIPVFWIDPGQRSLFLKGLATAWSMAMLLVLFVNEVRSRREWSEVFGGLVALGGWVAVGSLAYALELWRGDFRSLVGRLLPEAAVAESAFLHSISFRDFGTEPTKGLFDFRISSFALEFSGLSMVCIVLLPLLAWHAIRTKGARRYSLIVMVAGLMTGFVFTQSRLAYIALSIGMGGSLLLALWGRLGRRPRRAFVVGVLGTTLVVVALFHQQLQDLLRQLLLEVRPGSLQVRARVYRETWELLPRHWIAGWGVPQPIQGHPSIYSAGTHSSYLGMLFQHGVVGLALYLGIWLSVWRNVIHGLRSSAAGGQAWASFSIAVSIALFCFNIREAADSWWWDQLVTVTVWSTWGLVISGAREALGQDNEQPHHE